MEPIVILVAILLPFCCATEPESNIADQEDELIEVSAPAGRFRGTALVSQQGRLFKAYLGIPFALPPVGHLRFAKPEPYPKINHTYEATRFAPVCLQPSGVDLGTPAQEDCLYLNVYVPDSFAESQTDNTELKKVFVYIHGGGFFMGSSFEYIPGDLVTLGNVIVVTFNYRLSWLGFLKGKTPELPGNQGMWDQLLALHWVQDNIRSFGGDSDDITLGGNSMGGESVSALSIVPHGKGLFTKGLIMSGTMFTSQSTPGSSDVLLDWLTDRVGCKHDDVNTVVLCLRSLPSEAFILPLEAGITNKFTTIDGQFFPAPIGELISNTDYLSQVGFFSRNYLVTLTNNEGAVDFFGPFNNKIDPDAVSASQLSQILGLPTRVCEKILAWYKQPGHFNFKPAYDIWSDYIIGLPTYKFLETVSEHNSEESSTNGGRAYFLYFDYLPTYLPSQLTGMGHGFDLLYVFDLQPDQMLRYYYNLTSDRSLTELDLEMKQTYITMLVDLMHSGDPGETIRRTAFVEWPVFDLRSEHCLNFSSSPAVTISPISSRMHFWNNLLAQSLTDPGDLSHRTEL